MNEAVINSMLKKLIDYYHMIYANWFLEMIADRIVRDLRIKNLEYAGVYYNSKTYEILLEISIGSKISLFRTKLQSKYPVSIAPNTLAAFRIDKLQEVKDVNKDNYEFIYKAKCLSSYNSS